SAVSASELLAKILHHRRVELAVKSCPVESRRLIDADTRNRCGKLGRARRKESEVTGRYDMNVGIARQALRDARRARTVADAGPAELRSPELERHLDGGE